MHAPGWAPGWPCRQGSHRAPLSWLVLGVLPSGEAEPMAGRRRPGTRKGRHPTRPALCAREPPVPPVPPAWPLLLNFLRTPSASPSSPLSRPRLGELTSAQPPARPTSTRSREEGSFWRQQVARMGSMHGSVSPWGPGAGWVGRGWASVSRGQRGNHRPQVLWARSRLKGEV